MFFYDLRAARYLSTIDATGASNSDKEHACCLRTSPGWMVSHHHCTFQLRCILWQSNLVQSMALYICIMHSQPHIQGLPSVDQLVQLFYCTCYIVMLKPSPHLLANLYILGSICQQYIIRKPTSVEVLGYIHLCDQYVSILFVYACV